MKAKINKKKVLGYMFLPGIGPRLRNFSQNGLTSLAAIVALIYNAVGILPSSHPYLKPSMAGQFGIRHVVGEAGRHLNFSFKHIDQIIIFFSILLGLFLFVAQFALIIVGFFANTAHAGGGLPEGYGEYVRTFRPPDEDIALRLLDMVFGIPDFFGSQELTYLNVMADFHQALHGMYIIYSMGIVVIGALICCYFIGAVLIETAQTGTPFGKRFNHVWVPVRIIVAFGLLIPIGFGMNAGQYITLYAAKWGSGFATNGWVYFNEILADEGSASYLGNLDTLVATPNIPDLSHLQSFNSILGACEEIYERDPYNYDIDAYVIINSSTALPLWGLGGISILFPDILAYGMDQVVIRIGHQDPTYSEEKGFVKPLCGELMMDIHTQDEPGIMTLQSGYFSMAQAIATGSALFDPCGVYIYLASTYGLGGVHQFVLSSYGMARDNIGMLDAYLEAFVDTFLTEEQNLLYEAAESCMIMAQGELVSSSTWDIGQDGLNLGWAGAAIWYNRIAQMNGAFVSAVNNIPRVHKYPWVMEYVFQQKLQQDDSINPRDRFDPQLEQGREVQFQDPRDAEAARILNTVFQFWEDRGYARTELGTHTSLEGNAFIDTLNAIFGTQGLFDMCRNTDTHPLAQLATVGKGLIEAAIRNLGYSLASGVMGGAAYVLSPSMGAALNSMSSFFGTIAGIGLVIGFILYYVLPFMPFLYFFFAVGGWIKGIFEAMVGVPLWALAHLRIDGEGLPGDSAKYGYFLILEIFLRPIMILMGLLASIAICSAMVKVLNDIFWLVTSNISGHDPVDRAACGISGSTNFGLVGSEHFLRGPIDEFFFTIIYAVIVYMICTSCFKLIDQIPNEIMRWLGENVKTFNDERSETAEGLVSRITVGGGAIMGKLQGAAQQGASAVSSGGQGIIEQLKNNGN